MAVSAKPPEQQTTGSFRTLSGEPVREGVATKLLEGLGEFAPKGRPVEVRGHDFKDKELGHAIPYGVYDLAADEGWVSVGVTADTPSKEA